jgi:hypothetical protein
MSMKMVMVTDAVADYRARKKRGKKGIQYRETQGAVTVYEQQL